MIYEDDHKVFLDSFPESTKFDAVRRHALSDEFEFTMDGVLEYQSTLGGVQANVSIPVAWHFTLKNTDFLVTFSQEIPVTRKTDF